MGPNPRQTTFYRIKIETSRFLIEKNRPQMTDLEGVPEGASWGVPGGQDLEGADRGPRGGGGAPEGHIGCLGGTTVCGFGRGGSGVPYEGCP